MGNDIGDVIQTSGTSANITCYLADINSRSNLASFNVDGQIVSQNLSTSQGNHVRGSIGVSQVYR